MDIKREDVEEILKNTKCYKYGKKEIDQLMKEIKKKKGGTWSEIRDSHVEIMKFLFESQDLDYIQNAFFTMYDNVYSGQATKPDKAEWRAEMEEWIKADCWLMGENQGSLMMRADCCLMGPTGLIEESTYQSQKRKLLAPEWKKIDIHYRAYCDFWEFAWGILLGYGEHMEIAVLLEMLDDLHKEKKWYRLKNIKKRKLNRRKNEDYDAEDWIEDFENFKKNERFIHAPSFLPEEVKADEDDWEAVCVKMDEIDCLLFRYFNLNEWENIYRMKYPVPIKPDEMNGSNDSNEADEPGGKSKPKRQSKPGNMKIRDAKYFLQRYEEIYDSIPNSEWEFAKGYSFLYRLEKYLPLQFWLKYYEIYIYDSKEGKGKEKEKEELLEHKYIFKGLLDSFCEVDNPYIRLRLLDTVYFREKMQRDYIYLVDDKNGYFQKDKPEDADIVCHTYILDDEVQRINEKIMLSKKFLKLFLEDGLSKEDSSAGIIDDLKSAKNYFRWEFYFIINEIVWRDFCNGFNGRKKKDLYLNTSVQPSWFDKMVERSFYALKKHADFPEEYAHHLTGKLYYLS